MNGGWLVARRRLSGQLRLPRWLLALLVVLVGRSPAEAGLKLNLRFADGSTTLPLTVADVGSDIPIQIWASMSSVGGVNGSGTFFGLEFANFSVASARQVAGASGSIDGGLVSAALSAPFDQAGSQVGNLTTLSDDGIMDLGSNATLANPGFIRPQAASPVYSDNPTAIGQAISGGGFEFLVGTLSFHVDHVPGGPAVGAGTRFDVQIPDWSADNPNRAHWYQLSNQAAGNGFNNGNYLAGDAVVFAARAASEWVSSSSGVWSTATHWSPAEPNAKSAVVNFLTAPTAPVTVTLDTDKQAGILNFSHNQSYTLAGPGSLTLNPSGFDAQINVLRGSHIIAAPLVPIRSTTIRVDEDSHLQLSNLQSLAPVIRKTGPGGLTLSQAVYNNNLFLSVFDGTVRLTSDAGDSSLANLQLVGEQAGARIEFAAPQHIASLTLRFGASALNEGHYLHFRSFDVAADAGAVFDLGTGAVAVTYPGNPPVAKIRNLIISGINAEGALWEGGGITSSAAHDDPLGITTIGYADNSLLQYTHVSGLHFNYDALGEELPQRAILMKYTYAGDADLNGVVDGDDLVAFLVGYANQPALPEWSSGDFDYNGAIDGDDLTALLVAYVQQGGPLRSAVHLASVPEPASWIGGAWVVSALVWAVRRRRQATIQA